MSAYCQAIHGDPSKDGDFYVCCRYDGHPGDHEEWVNSAGDPTDPIKGRMAFSWAAANIGDAGARDVSLTGPGSP